VDDALFDHPEAHELGGAARDGVLAEAGKAHQVLMGEAAEKPAPVGGGEDALLDQVVERDDDHCFVWADFIAAGHHRGRGLLAPGHAWRNRSLQQQYYALGELSGRLTPRLEELARIMSDAGKTRTTTNLWGARWSKLVLNCVSSAMTALAGFVPCAEVGMRQTRRCESPRASW
jgi:hypothetical protein